MRTHSADIEWRRGTQAFVDNRYSRAHRWRFDGGLEVPASASPHVVQPPGSDPAAIDPEEAFVAALASCHMLWFLSLVAAEGYCVDGYRDEAEGVMAKNAEGEMAITRVTLHPRVEFSGPNEPTVADQERLHEQAHRRCFIANSVKTEVRCEPFFQKGPFSKKGPGPSLE